VQASDRVIWEPLKGSQALTTACRCNHILSAGTRGPGKTDAQLMFFRQFVGLGYGAFWRGVIFDREYKMLDDLVAKSMKWFPQFGDGAEFKASKSDYKWVWPTGEELLFRSIKKGTDYWNYHGHEFPFIGWNELTKYPTSELYDSMMACNRSSFLPHVNGPRNRKTGQIERLLPEIPLVVFSTTNPYGPGHNWVKSQFIDAGDPGEVMRTTVDVFNPRTRQREPITKTQTWIFGSYKENWYLSPEYIMELEKIKDPVKRKAWLMGDWNIVVGGAFDDVWSSRIIIPRFQVPTCWPATRSLDWGSTHPFSVGFWVRANGEAATMPNGDLFCPPAGTLIRIDEWYGTEKIGTNKGLKMSAKLVAAGIKEREEALRRNGWLSDRVYPGPADNQIGTVNDSGTETIKARMAADGIEWDDCDKSPGSRKLGFQAARDRFEAVGTGDAPACYITENCKAARALLPTLPRDEENPDDIDTDAEDHLWDEMRLELLHGGNVMATTLDLHFPS